MANETGEIPRSDTKPEKPSDKNPELGSEESNRRLIEENQTNKLQALLKENAQSSPDAPQISEEDQIKQLRAHRRANEPLIVRNRRSPYFHKQDPT